MILSKGPGGETHGGVVVEANTTQAAAKRSQHVNATHRNIVECNMLRALFSNLSQQHPTCRNTVAKRTQHVAPNNVEICCVGMLRSFGRGLRWKAQS